MLRMSFSIPSETELSNALLLSARNFQILLCHSLDLVEPVAGSFSSWLQASRELPLTPSDFVSTLASISTSHHSELTQALAVALLFAAATLTDAWHELVDATQLLKQLERMIYRNATAMLTPLTVNQLLVLTLVRSRLPYRWTLLTSVEVAEGGSAEWSSVAEPHQGVSLGVCTLEPAVGRNSSPTAARVACG